MARQSIDKARTRARLAPRREPYWGAPIARGLFVGFRKLPAGGAWIARWRDEDGRQRYQSFGHADAMSYEDAAAKARAWCKSLAAGVEATGTETVEDACKAYVADLRLEKREGAATDAEGRFNRTVYGTPFGKLKLAMLRTAKIKDWRADLDMGAASKNRTLTALKAALNKAVADRLMDAGKAIEWKQVKPLDAKNRLPPYLDAAQRSRLIETLPSELQSFAGALYLTALRPGALAEAKVEDLRGGSLYIRAHDKGHGERTVVLSADAKAIMRKEAKSKLPLAPLFAQPDGSHWSKGDWGAPIRDAIKPAKLPPRTVAYSLRHSAITDLLTAGADPLTVCKQAGTSMLMLQKHYAHLLDKHAAKAMGALAL
jgi:site-specific recombinase XerD